ncbi:MAG: hypothetical protein ACI4DT_08230 [Chordicoccus sp.]
MIFIFTALVPEAEPLIQEFSLKRTGGGSAFQQFANEEQGMLLTITRTGPVRAAAAVGAVLGKVSPDEVTLVLNFGSCAAVHGGMPEGGETPLYLIQKLTNMESGRQWYPDLLTGSCLPEAELLTGSRLYTGDEMREDRGIPALSHVLLYDMEGAAFFEAANLFVGPHRIHVLKFVTDSGDTGRVTPDTVRRAAEAALPRAAEYLRLVMGEDCCGKYAMKSFTANGEEAERMTAVKISSDADAPLDEDALARGLCASRMMRAQLHQLILYADLAGLKWRGRVRQWTEKGVYPAKDRRTGKQLLAELKGMVQGVQCDDKRR